MKKYIVISVLIIIARVAAAQMPAWENQITRENLKPIENFYRGYFALRVEKNEDLEEAKLEAMEKAKTELTESIEVTITSSTDNYVKENMTTSDGNKLKSDFISSFASKSTSNSKAVLTDLQKIDPVYDSKSHTWFAFVYVDKRKMLLKNQNIVDNKLLQLQTKLSNARLFLEQSKEIEALQQLAQSETIYEDIENAMGWVFTISSKFYKFEEYASQRFAAEELVSKINSSQLLDIEEMARLITNELTQQTGANLKHILIFEPVTYENTVYSTNFSSQLQEELSNQMQKKNYQIGSKLTPEIKEHDWLAVKGSYYVRDNTIRIFINMIGQPTGRNYAKATGYVSKDWLKANHINYEPEEMTLVNERRVELAPISSSPDVSLTVYDRPKVSATNFIWGDTLRLDIKVSKPGYLRIQYLCADKSVGLMLDNYQITPDMVGKRIKLENMENWKDWCIIFSGPAYGEEDVMIAFSEKPFKKLNTKEVYVKDENGKDQLVLQVTDNQMEAIEITKSSYVPYQEALLQEVSSYYAQKDLRIKLLPKN